MGGVKKGFMGIMGVLFRMITPAMTMITKLVGNFVNSIRKHQGFLKVFFTMVAGLVTGLLLPSILAFFGALLTNPITWVVLALAGLALVIEDLITWMEGGESEFGDFWASLFGSPEEAKKTFEELQTDFWTFVDTVVELGKEIGTALLPVLKILGEYLSWLWENVIKPALPLLKTLWKVLAFAFVAPIAAVLLLVAALTELWNMAEDGETIFKELWTALFGDPDGFKNMVNDITSYFKNLWQSAVKWVQDKWNALKDTAQGVCNAIKTAVSDFANFIMSAIGGAIDWALSKWQAFKAAILGDAASVDFSPTVNHAGEALASRVSNSTRNNSVINIGKMTLNGVQNGSQAAADFSAGLSNNSLVAQSNAGAW
jgi:hypothetical protein